jgi:hypothetical protein
MKIIFEFDIEPEFEDMVVNIADEIETIVDEIVVCGDSTVENENHGRQMLGDCISSWKYEVES